MKQVIFFLFFCPCLLAQTFTDTLSVSNNQLELKLTDTKIQFELDQTSDKLILTGREVKAIAEGAIKVKNFSSDTVTLANGKKQVTFKFNIKRLVFNCLEIKDAPATCVFTTPKYNPKDKPKFGLKYVSEYVFPSSTNLSTNQVIITNIPDSYREKGCALSGSNLLSSLKEIRLVACSSDPSILQKKTTIRTYLENNLGLKIITEETNIPPPADAVNRINDGITIRYFDTNTRQHSQELESRLRKLSELSGDDFRNEDMLACCYSSPIVDYLEIWIK